MLHDPIDPTRVSPLASPPADLADAEPFLTLPPLRALQHPDRALPDRVGHDRAPGAPSPAQPSSGLSARGDQATGPAVPGASAGPVVDFAAISAALYEIATLRAEQILKWGHTPEKDAGQPVIHLPRAARDLLAAACDDIQFHRSGPAFAHARPRIRQRLLKAGALIAAALDRLDAEPDDAAEWPSL